MTNREALRAVVSQWALDDTCLRNDVERFLDDVVAASQPPSGDAPPKCVVCDGPIVASQDTESCHVVCIDAEHPATPAPLDVELVEWVNAEHDYWEHVRFIQENPDPEREPDFAPFNRWKAAQAAAHEQVARAYANQEGGEPREENAPRYPAPLNTDLAGDETSPR